MLSGLAVIIVGFAIRLNPLLVVTLAGFATGLSAGLNPAEVVAMIGKAFAANRFIAVAWLVLPVIGLLERAGLREHARRMVSGLRGATAGRVLIGYFTVRQLTAMLGLTSLGGHVQMVRPVIAPMVESAAERDGPIGEPTRFRLRAHAAAADNIALFFGEDVFIAIGSILLILGFLSEYGIAVSPLEVALWAVPTAISAFLVHCTRLLLLDRHLAKHGASR